MRCPASAWQRARRTQAVACIGVIIAGGRTLLRPIYRRIADMGNADVFAALTLLVVLGTSVLTQIAGLSLALGAFLVRARRGPAGRAGRGCRTRDGAAHKRARGAHAGLTARGIGIWLRRPCASASAVDSATQGRRRVRRLPRG